MRSCYDHIVEHVDRVAAEVSAKNGSDGTALPHVVNLQRLVPSSGNDHVRVVLLKNQSEDRLRVPGVVGIHRDHFHDQLFSFEIIQADSAVLAAGRELLVERIHVDDKGLVVLLDNRRAELPDRAAVLIDGAVGVRAKNHRLLSCDASFVGVAHLSPLDTHSPRVLLRCTIGVRDCLCELGVEQAVNADRAVALSHCEVLVVVVEAATEYLLICQYLSPAGTCSLQRIYLGTENDDFDAKHNQVRNS